jgi:signal transduction histidine kinase
MKLRTAVVWGIAWAHLALAGAAGVDWGAWSAQRREGAYRDLPGEIRQLRADVAQAQKAHDAVAHDLALGRLLFVLNGYDERELDAAAEDVNAALAAARQRKGADAGRFSLLIGAAYRQIGMQDGAAVRELLDEAGRVATELHQPAMQAEIEAVRALSLVYDGDASAAEAAAQKAAQLNPDPLLAAQVFQGPGFIARVLSIHQPSDAAPLFAEIDQRIARAPAALPYLSFGLAMDRVVLYRRIRQPEAAQRALLDAVHRAEQQPSFVVPHDVRRLQASLYQDTQDWDGCIETMRPLAEATSSLMARVDMDMTLAVCQASKKSPQAIHYIDELEKALPAFQGKPALKEAVLNAQASAYERLGDFPAALRKAKATRAATLERVSKANEAMRQQMQTKFDVAAKDKENLLLKNRQEVLERRRLELGLAAAALAIGLVVLGELLRRQSVQRRRLAQLSAALEGSNRDLRAANERLEDINASRTRLLAAACHDLRQPAHALGMLAEIATAKAGADSQGTIAQIRRASASLSDLLDMLFDLSRLQADRYVPVLAAVPLAETLADLQVSFTIAAVRKGLRFVVDETAEVVQTDPHLLRRILMNLTSNAIRYTVSGHVRIEVVRQGTQVMVSVDDSGPGIPPDQQGSIFSEYVRLDRSGHADGLGIGLAIVKRSADLLGHALTLDSVPGRGTRFTLVLPVSEGPGERTEVRTDADGAGRLVALIEDDEQVRGAMAELLRAQGYAVLAAGDRPQLVEALEAAGRPLPDLLVSDFHLGAEDGLQLLTRLRQANPGWAAVPTLLITGNLDAELSGRTVAMGVVIAHKPVPPRRLLQTIAQLLDGAPRPLAA